MALVAAQVFGERINAGVALRRIGAQRVGDDSIEVAMQLPRALPALGGFPVGVVQHRIAGWRRHACGRGRTRGIGGAARVRVDAGQQAVQQHAQRIDVAAGADGFAGHLLGAGITRRVDVFGVTGDVIALVAQQFGDAEVEQFDLSVRRHQHVGWLDVPMQHQVPVRIGDRIAELQEQVQRGVQVGAREELVDGLALDILHHQEWLAVAVFAAVDQVGDVRVLQPRQQLTFDQEA